MASKDEGHMNDLALRGTRAERFAAVLLGVAALLSAYATMRSAIIGDEVLENFTLSSQHYNEGNRLDDANTQTFVADQNLFLRYVESTVAGDDALGTYLTDVLFSDSLRAAVEWWEQEQTQPDAPESPFDERSPYRFEEEPAVWFDRGVKSSRLSLPTPRELRRSTPASNSLSPIPWSSGPAPTDLPNTATAHPSVEQSGSTLIRAADALWRMS